MRHSAAVVCFFSIALLERDITAKEEGRGLRCTVPAELAAATSELNALEKLIESAASAEQVHDVQKSLRALMQKKCFKLSVENARVPDTDSAGVFKAWWRNGGRRWMVSYVATRDLVVVPNDPQAFLPDEADEGAPAPPGLCLERDAACVAEAQEYRQHFEQQHRVCRRGQPKAAEIVGCSGLAIACTDAATKGYVTWRRCIEANRPLELALPFGDVKLPSRGWLVIRGGANGNDCESASVYDVGTGETESVSRCKATGDASARRVKLSKETGSVSLQRLREALWFLLTSPSVRCHQTMSCEVPVPAGLAPEWPASQPSLDVQFARERAACGDDCTTSWEFSGDEKLIRGKIGPSLPDSRDEYAMQLIDGVAKTFVKAPIRRTAPLKLVDPKHLFGHEF